MFSKKPQLATQTPSPSGDSGGLLKRMASVPITNPYLGAGAAGVLLLASIGLLVAMGDPLAGAPKVRVGLGEPATPAAGDLGGFGYGDYDASAIDMIPIDALDDLESPYGGQAVITLPNGEQQMVTIGAGRGSLPPAPIAGLSQQGPNGPLPVIAADGMTPARAYARPFEPNGDPMVSVIIGGLGIDPTATQQAIELLPPEVTLSFAARDVENLQGWINMARAAGHEVLIDIPMEPRSFPQDDPGPGALMTSGGPDEIASRLDAFLARGSGYFGVTNYMGSKFLTSSTAYDALSASLRARGLAFIDDGVAADAAGGIPRASANRMIDDTPGADAIGYQLAQLEQAASQGGQALGSGFAYPITVRQVAAWARTLESRGYQLAPASALTVRR